MSFELKFSKQATNFIRNLQPVMKERIKKKFKNISENPLRYLKSFKNNSLSKIRIGEYRALVDRDNQREILFIRVFDKRGRIYKRK